MPSIDLKHLPHLKALKRKSGAIAYYVQRTARGKAIRLLEDPEQTPKLFHASYNKAIQDLAYDTFIIDGRNKINTHTINALVKVFKDDGGLDGLKPNTVQHYNYAFDKICNRFGLVKFSQLTSAIITRFMDELPPYAGNKVLQAFKRLTKWATKRGYVNLDPARDIQGRPRSKTGFPVWEERHIEQYCNVHPIGTHARLCMDLLQYTGLRIGDMIEIGPQHIKDGFIVKKCNKTGQEITIPFNKALKESIDASQTGSQTFLRMRRFDQPYKDSRAFGEVFRAFCKQAGLNDAALIKGLSGHGLRKTVATRALLNGATTTETAAFLGWTSTAMPDHYARAINRQQIGMTRGHMMFPKQHQSTNQTKAD